MSNHVLAFSAERLLQILKSLPAVNAYIVGFSGGADSTALLHALSRIHRQLDTPVSAVHVNHGIHPDADLWQQQCENFCRRYGIELVCLRIEMQCPPVKGLEAEARHLRYAAISDRLNPADCLLTAHHADDQAETLLLNLMRGSGVDGLSAMPASRSLGAGFLQRPLLQFKNSALRDYLSENDIAWTEDPSNYSLNHDRNFVRHEVIPLLEQHWPEVSQRLLLTQAAMSGARVLLEKLADEYLETSLIHPFVLQISPHCGASPELFKLVIRRWLKQTGSPGISAYKLGTFCTQVQQANSDTKVSVRFDGWLLRLYRKQLWLQTDLQIQPCPALNWPDVHNKIDLGNDTGQFEFRTGIAAGKFPGPPGSFSKIGDFSVCSRLDVKGAVINQGRGHKSLKNMFQSYGIPPWLRASIPLCRLDGEVVAVGDWCFSAQFTSWLSANGIGLHWHPRHPLLQFIHKQLHRLKH